MSEHLWPLSEAVAAALNLPCVLHAAVDGGVAVAVYEFDKKRGAHCWDAEWGSWRWVLPTDLRLDLRRVDHRAWAAWEFTVFGYMGRMPGLHADPDLWGAYSRTEGAGKQAAWDHIHSIERAHAMDPSLTAAELLPALVWAMGVANG